MSRNIRTFNDIGGDNESGHDSDGDHDHNDHPEGGGRPQDFYVGSGQAVQGPRGPSNPNELLRRVISSARANGVDTLTPEQLAEDQSGAEVVSVTLHAWRNGFSVDNGPLRAIDTPEGQAFFHQITRGQIPPEIQAQHRGKQIDMKLSKHDSEYETPKMKAFEGTGVRLGNVVPTVVTDNNGGASASNAAAGTVPTNAGKEEEAKNLENAKKELNVDSAQPTTNIQIRLPNNQRIVGTFNQSHTISAVRNFICTAHPELVYQPFQLMTTYPNKVLDDETASLKDANLLNSVIAIKPQV